MAEFDNMTTSLPLAYRGDKWIQALLHTVELEDGRVRENARGMAAQMFLDSMSWQLAIEERELGLRPEADLDRRGAISAKWRSGAGRVGIEHIREVCEAWSGTEAEVSYDGHKLVTVLINSGDPDNAITMLKILRVTVPAHLLMELAFYWQETIGSFKGGFTFQNVQFPFRFVSYGDGVIRLDGTRKLNGTLLLNQEFKNVKLVSMKFALPISKTENRVSSEASFEGIKTKTGNEVKLKSEAARVSLYENEECDFENASFVAAYRDTCGSMNGVLTKDTMWKLNGSANLDGDKKINAAIIKEAI